VFRLLGFDVRIRPGFVVFMLLIVLVYGDEFGVWLAGSLAAFTLVHELGHAVVARRHGADAEISLDFLAGYTSYRPRTALTRVQRVLISAAGPGTHIAVSLAVLVAMGVNPLDPDSVNETASSAAVWWAGPVIGLVNLIPVLPLDGGHIAQSGLEAVLGERARRTMAWISIGLTSAFAVLCALDPDRRGWFLFIAFLLISQIQILSASSAGSPGRRRAALGAAAEAERSAWQTGRPGMLVPGQVLSPWYRAHRALLSGQPDEARRLVIEDLTSSGPRHWWPPSDARPEQLRALVALLPRPFPPGNATSEQVLAEVLLATGDVHAAGTYAAAAFARSRVAGTAVVVARAAAALGDRDTALRWLHAAAATPGAMAAADAIDHAPELAGLRDDPDVRNLRASLSPV
jgi:Zn-dependent protease